LAEPTLNTSDSPVGGSPSEEAFLSQQDDTPVDAFRTVNEHVRQLAAMTDDKTGRDDSWEFMCECGELGCLEHVQLRVSEFDAVVASGGNVLADGHVLLAAGQARANARRLVADAEALQAQAEQAVRHVLQQSRSRRESP
jgi:hypothetical protein